MPPYVFETQAGREFYQCLKTEYPELCEAAIAEAREEDGAPGAIEAALTMNIAQLISELPYNYPCRDIDVRHFAKLSEDKSELSSVAGQIAAALLQDVGTGNGDSVARNA
jgi:hypothetical protein